MDAELPVLPLTGETSPEACNQLINKLLGLPVETGYFADIGILSGSLDETANSDRFFLDKGAFAMIGMDKYVIEATEQMQLRLMLEEGESFAAMLYTWRSCSVAIPSVDSADKPNKNETYEQILQILEPEINKLREFMNFQKRATAKFTENVQHLCKEMKDGFRSEAYLRTIGDVINMFATLDELKNIKSSVMNDYSSWKRTCEALKRMSDPAAFAETQQMSNFLATQNFILSSLKRALDGTENFEDLLCEIVSVCVSAYEEHKYASPNEKHSLLKVIGLCLYLIDGEKTSIYKLDVKTKKLNLSKIDKFYKKIDIVPLYGDNMMSSYKCIVISKNFDQRQWPNINQGSSGQHAQAQLVQEMPEIRQQFITLVSDLVQHRKVTTAVTQQKSGNVSDAEQHAKDKLVCDLALRALRQVGQWTARIREFYSYKIAHPADPSVNKDIPADAEDLEKATRYNYTSAEKSAMTELLGMTKNCQKMLQAMEVQIAESGRRFIFHELQDFVQKQLREPLRKAVKHKANSTMGILIKIMYIGSDVVDMKTNAEDPIYTGKKDTGEYNIKMPKKQVLPSSTQWYLLRTMLESLVGQKSLRKELSAEHITLIENFLTFSRSWPYLIDFEKTLHECCDLSQLWYREYFLELARGRRSQFPIEMSMPWILTEHMLDSKEPNMVEYLVYPFDLYNDSASCALRLFKKQFLYDEIEAEVNLCFDQLTFKLSECIFAYYKKAAGILMMNKRYRHLCVSLGAPMVSQPPLNKYDSVMKITNVELVGRNVNLSRIITQRMNALLLRSLDIAISRFEAGDLTGVIELEGLIECNRLTHRLLRQFIHLDDFDLLLNEANCRVTVPYGRIAIHILTELSSDFLAQFCFNMTTCRFTRTVLPFVDAVERDKPPSAHAFYGWGSKVLESCYNIVYNQYRGFVGRPHFLAMCRLLNYQDIAFILRQLLDILKTTIQSTAVPYVEALMSVMPKRCILPQYSYGSLGVFSYFEAQLHDIIVYADLQPKVMQCLREIGNAIIFADCLEKALFLTEGEDIVHSAMFQNIIPKPYVKRGKDKVANETDLRAAVEQLEKKYRNVNVKAVVSSLGNQEQGDLVKGASVLTEERLVKGLSLTGRFLRNLTTLLTDNVWHPESKGATNLSVSGSMEFHKLWSALQFIICIPTSAHNMTSEYLFGDSVTWAGCVLITLLGQQRRFEAMDLSYHLLNVHAVDQKNDTVKGVSIMKMVQRIREHQKINNTIFAMLECILPETVLVEPQHEVPPTETQETPRPAAQSVE